MRAIRRFSHLILAAVVLSLFPSCAAPSPLTPTTPIGDLPAALPAEQEGVFLAVASGEVFLLTGQHLSPSESVSVVGLPRSDDPRPAVVLRGSGFRPSRLALRRMVGGIGFSFRVDQQSGAVEVTGVRPGFGAETGGLRD